MKEERKKQNGRTKENSTERKKTGKKVREQ